MRYIIPITVTNLDSKSNSAYTTEFLDGPGKLIEGQDFYGQEKARLLQKEIADPA